MPPIFGGKSFVTSRCFTGARGRRPDQTQLLARPLGVLGEHLVVAPAEAGQRGHDPLVAPVRRVAHDDQRVAPQPAWVAAGEVPPTVAIEQRRVVGVQQVEGVDPRLGVLRQRPAVSPAQVDRRRARLLAVVAAVQAVADRRTELDGYGTRALQHPGETAVGVDDARGDDRAGRAGIDAPMARPAPVGDGLGGHRVLRRRDHAPEDEPAAGPRAAGGWRSSRTSRARPGRRPRDRRSSCRRRTPRPAGRRPAAGGPSPADPRAGARSGRPRRSGRRGPAAARRPRAVSSSAR